MVAETKQDMTKMFEKTAENVRGAMDAGFGAQQAWFNACGDFFKRAGGFGTVLPQTDKIAKEFGPFVGKSIDAMTDCLDAGFRANMNAFKAACDVTTKMDEGDVYNKSREVMDAAFQAVKTNVDAFGKVGKRTVDNWTTLCSSTCCESQPTSGKTTERTAK